MEGDKELYSYHIFLFPFKWKHWKGTNKESFMKERYNLELFQEKLKGSDWKHVQYQNSSTENYNEYNYFYGHVREILYDLGEDLQTEDAYEHRSLVKHFEYLHNGVNSLLELDWQYEISLSETETFNLTIDSIHLNMYRTGVGMLVFHLRNFVYSSPEDILKINQYGRRLYPPFYVLGKQSVIDGLKDEILEPEGLEKSKGEEIPNSIAIKNKEKYLFKESYGSYSDLKNVANGPFLIPKFISGLFPDNFLCEHENNDKKRLKYEIYLRPVLDDRMFVISWFGNDAIARKYGTFDFFSKEYGFAEDDWWYKYIFVDVKWPSCSDRNLLVSQIKEHTYSRWVEPYGTLYGICRYSFVALTSNLIEDNAFLVRHVQTMYYKMVELALVQRATVLNYSDEITHVSDLTQGGEEDYEKVAQKIKEVHKHYVLFINKIHFREVTAQEQGIELYDMLQQHFRLPTEVKMLGQEIGELNSYANQLAEKKRLEDKEEERKQQEEAEKRRLEEREEDRRLQVIAEKKSEEKEKNKKFLIEEKERKQKRKIDKITYIGAVFFPLSLMASIIGSNFFQTEFVGLSYEWSLDSNFWKRFGLLTLSSLVIFFILDIIISWEKVILLIRHEKNVDRTIYSRVLFRVLVYFIFLFISCYFLFYI